MKKIITLSLLIGSVMLSHGQFVKFGLRAGFSTTQIKMSDFVNVKQQINGQEVPCQLNFSPNVSLGLQGGIFTQVSVGMLYVQPELLFATSNSEVTVESSNVGTTVKKVVAQQSSFRIDIPAVAGVKFGPARIGLGPVASIYLKNKDELGDKIAEVMQKQSQNTTAKIALNTAVWGAQINAGLDIFGKVAIDLKYEIGLSRIGNGININGLDYNFHKRANQFIFLVGYMF